MPAMAAKAAADPRLDCDDAVQPPPESDLDVAELAPDWPGDPEKEPAVLMDPDEAEPEVLIDPDEAEPEATPDPECPDPPEMLAAAWAGVPVPMT